MQSDVVELTTKQKIKRVIRNNKLVSKIAGFETIVKSVYHLEGEDFVRKSYYELVRMMKLEVSHPPLMIVADELLSGIYAAFLPTANIVQVFGPIKALANLRTKELK